MVYSRFYQFFLLFVIFICTFESPAKGIAQDLVLGDQPLTESEKLVILDLFDEKRVRDYNLPPIKVVEGQVTLGKSYIFFLPPQRSMPPKPFMTPDRSKWDLYLIHLRFTIHEPPENKYYQKVVFQIALANRDTTAFDLLPKNVTYKEEITKTYMIYPQFKFKEVEGKVGEIGYKVRFENLRPIISAFGEGESRFYWVYTSQKGQRVFPGTKHALVILEVPREIKSVHGTIHYEVVMAKKLVGEWLFKDVKTNYYSINWNLSEAKPLFEVKY